MPSNFLLVFAVKSAEIRCNFTFYARKEKSLAQPAAELQLDGS